MQYTNCKKGERPIFHLLEWLSKYSMQRSGLAAVGGVAVSAPAQNLIKETNYYLKHKVNK